MAALSILWFLFGILNCVIIWCGSIQADNNNDEDITLGDVSYLVLLLIAGIVGTFIIMLLAIDDGPFGDIVIVKRKKDKK